MYDTKELYVDGGVVGVNPSHIGGTWGCVLVKDPDHYEMSGYITPQKLGTPMVSNNQTEMMAMLIGMSWLQHDFSGTIYSDSQVTIGRVSLGWKWKNIPQWMHEAYQYERKRLIYWNQIKFVLLDGHPTKVQLEQGIGKRGHPVSKYNVICDELCRKEAIKCRKEHDENMERSGATDHTKSPA